MLVVGKDQEISDMMKQLLKQQEGNPILLDSEDGDFSSQPELNADNSAAIRDLQAKLDLAEVSKESAEEDLTKANVKIKELTAKLA